MNKQKKSGAWQKRRQKNGQMRPAAERNLRKDGSDRPSRAHEAPPHPSAPRKPQRNEDERKRKLWERKQAELEARWASAQSRQTIEDAARKRTRKIVRSIIGTGMAALLCALAWYVAQGGFHISIPA